jgi:hypothetical protein
MQRRCNHAFPTIERLCFTRGPCKVVIKKNSFQKPFRVELSSETPACQDMSLGAEELNWIELRSWQLQRRIGDGSGRWLRRNGKKWIRLCKEDSVCDLKLQWDCYKSVARIRLVKTENPIVCSSKLYSADISGSAVIACNSEWFVWGVNKSNNPIQNPSYILRTTQQVIICNY